MNIKACIAEFIGTFGLVFTAIGALASNHIINSGEIDLLAIALSQGLIIAVMVSATAAISGGHLNPAVTIGALTAGKIDSGNAIGYIVAQCLGGIVAVALVKVCIPADVLVALAMGTPALGEGISTGMGLVTEIILTFFLVFVIFGTAIDKRAPQVGGLFIGLTVALDILIGGPISGAAMNPARHLGPAILGGGTSNIWLYWVGPIIGGILAAQIYQRISGEDDSSEETAAK